MRSFLLIPVPGVGIKLNGTEFSFHHRSHAQMTESEWIVFDSLDAITVLCPLLMSFYGCSLAFKLITVKFPVDSLEHDH